MQCPSCGALTPRRSKSNAGKIILTILGVFVVAIAIVFAGCAMLLSNVAP
jgi:flagellar basal body-associated protein FliL